MAIYFKNVLLLIAWSSCVHTYRFLTAILAFIFYLKITYIKFWNFISHLNLFLREAGPLIFGWLPLLLSLQSLLRKTNQGEIFTHILLNSTVQWKPLIVIVITLLTHPSFSFTISRSVCPDWTVFVLWAWSLLKGACSQAHMLQLRRQLCHPALSGKHFWASLTNSKDWSEFI